MTMINKKGSRAKVKAQEKTQDPRNGRENRKFLILTKEELYGYRRHCGPRVHDCVHSSTFTM